MWHDLYPQCQYVIARFIQHKLSNVFLNLTISPGIPMKPELKDLVLVKTTKWYNLGLQLGIEDTELDVIEENSPKDIDACKRKMFKAWLRITPQPILPKAGGSSANSGRDQ